MPPNLHQSPRLVTPAGPCQAAAGVFRLGLERYGDREPSMLAAYVNFLIGGCWWLRNFYGLYGDIYGDLMGYYSDLMGFYSDLMGY